MKNLFKNYNIIIYIKMINFCKICESMLYPVEHEKNLFLKCKNCGYQEDNKNLIIFSKVYNDNSMETENVSNRYIIHDKTIPRTKKKKCPNNLCPSRNDKSKQEAVFYSVEKTMELIYVCRTCSTEWKYT